MNTTPAMESSLLYYAEKGLIVPRSETSCYLKMSYKGAGGIVPVMWNVKIYTSGHVVTTDANILNKIVNRSLSVSDKKLRLLQINDCGWGFPLCGVMVGVSNGTEMMTAVVDVRWFRKGVFETKKYLKEYSRVAKEVLDEHFNATPALDRIEICEGFLNSVLKEDLCSAGYDVREADITGFAQDHLEGCYKEYVRTALGVDLWYDPKQCVGNKSTLSKKYSSVVEWGRRHRPDMLKNGMLSMKA